MNRALHHDWFGVDGAGFVAAIAVIIVSSTVFIWLASNGATVLTVFPFCWLSWISYLFAHSLVDGYPVDESTTEPVSSRQLVDTVVLFVSQSPTHRVVLAVVGLASMFVAFPTGIISVHRNDFWLLLVGHTLFIGGYVVGHHGLTEKPL